MKLFLKRDTSMEHTRFLVNDHKGGLKYVVTGKRSAAVDRMAISSVDSHVLLNITVAPLHFFYAFIVSGEKQRFSMVTSNPVKTAQFRFYGIDWTLCRSADRRSFEIFDSSGKCVMLQSADGFHRTGAYTLEIFNSAMELNCIAAAICADVINYADSAVTATV